MTTAPASATLGASSFEVPLPAENSTMSRPAVVGGGRVLDRDLAVSATEGAARRAGGGEEPQLVDGELALGQHLPHDATDLAGGADDADPHGHQNVRPGPCSRNRYPAT